MDADEDAEGGEEEEEAEHPAQIVWRRPTGRGPQGKEWDTSIGELTFTLTPTPPLTLAPTLTLLPRPWEEQQWWWWRCGSMGIRSG